MVIISQGHGGTPVFGKDPHLVCDCGLEFPMTQHPVESEVWDSVGWIAHVRQVRREEQALTEAKVSTKVVGEGNGWVLR